MPDHHNKKRFLNLPKYTGGTPAFREFIEKNLRYPDAAMESRIEGSVIVGYDVHDNGEVSNQHILKGLGYGCDEEAMRVVGLLRFDKVKNRGVRVKLTTKTTINFRLPAAAVSYTISYTGKSTSAKAEPEQKPAEAVTYNYTINL